MTCAVTRRGVGHESPHSGGQSEPARNLPRLLRCSYNNYEELRRFHTRSFVLSAIRYAALPKRRRLLGFGNSGSGTVAAVVRPDGTRKHNLHVAALFDELGSCGRGCDTGSFDSWVDLPAVDLVGLPQGVRDRGEVRKSRLPPQAGSGLLCCDEAAQCTKDS